LNVVELFKKDQDTVIFVKDVFIGMIIIVFI